MSWSIKRQFYSSRKKTDNVGDFHGNLYNCRKKTDNVGSHFIPIPNSGMDTKEIFETIDNLVFSQTGKHLDNLQSGILKSVFNGQKYSEVANENNCTEGHARDKAYELWRTLSDALGEELNKSNIKATFERILTKNRLNMLGNNYSSVVGNPVHIGIINLCQNSDTPIENVDIDNVDVKIKVKLETVPRLIQLGLTTEQVAQALDLPSDLILDVINQTFSENN